MTYADAVVTSGPPGVYREVKMHAATDSAVRDLVPGLLDAAGLLAEADEMRSVDMLSASCVGDAVRVLRKVREETEGRWAPLLQEACFWVEAMVWAAWEGDAALFEECQAALEKSITDGLALMAVH